MIMLLAFASQQAFSEQVKKSRSGICHDRSSIYYEKMKNFRPYPNLKDCLNHGGRLPKYKSNNRDKDLTIYDRNDYPHWIDEDKDCKNTRAEILIRDSLKPVEFKRAKGCLVISGKWLDPYTNKIFVLASDIDVDHIVPIYHAHKMGAYKWTKKQKKHLPMIL